MKKIILTSLVVFVALASVIWACLWWTHIRIHGTEVAAEFTSFDGVTLRGSVFLPDSDGPHPGIVFLHGSGPEKSDDIAYVVLMNAFVKKGFAVLIYDKRGVGNSDGDFETALYADFIEDGLAGLRYLRERDDIAADKIGLAGLSEGGWFTPEIAVRDGNVAFIVNRVGPPISWIRTMRWEIRNELLEAGITDEALIAQLLDLRVRIWKYYADAVEAEQPFPARRAALAAELAALGDSWRQALPMRVADYDLSNYRAWVSDISYDPQPFLYQLDIPLHSTYAGADQNVPAEESVAELERIRNEYGKDIEIVVYPGRRHSMFKWYNLMTAGFPPDFLDRVSSWAAEQVENQAAE